MKKATLTICVILLSFANSFSQPFTTPNTGVNWNLNDIVAASPNTVTVSGTDYTLLRSLIVAENDTLIIDSDLTLFINAGLRIKVYGVFIVDSNHVTITAANQNAPYSGLRFEENSTIHIKNATITYGGGLRVMTDNFIIENSTLSYNENIDTVHSTIELFSGTPQILNNTISFNSNAAIGWYANKEVSPKIEGNLIKSNGQKNKDYGQIHLGPSIPTQDLYIVNNMIIGDITKTNVGAITTAGETRGYIIGNTIRNNRYGMELIVSSVTITDNIIEDNNIQGNPGRGGWGIGLYSTNGTVKVRRNEIRRNLWGITLNGEATMDLGNDSDGGYNIFSENKNGGVTNALYNDTANTILAKNNCWIEGHMSSAQDVEDVIFHKVDNAPLGEVIFDPFLCGILSVSDNTLADFTFYPNPVKNEINFNNIHSLEKVEIYGIQGNLISTKIISEGQNVLPINLSSGMYFVNFSNDAQTVTKKMIVE